MPDLFDHAGHVSGASYAPPIACAPAVIENLFGGGRRFASSSWRASRGSSARISPSGLAIPTRTRP